MNETNVIPDKKLPGQICLLLHSISHLTTYLWTHWRQCQNNLYPGIAIMIQCQINDPHES